MRSIAMIIVLAAFAEALDMEQTTDLQDSMDNFINDLADELIDRALTARSLPDTAGQEDTDLDDTTLGKPGHSTLAKPGPLSVGNARPAVSMRPGLMASSPVLQSPGLLSSPMVSESLMPHRGTLVVPQAMAPISIMITHRESKSTEKSHRRSLKRNMRNRMRKSRYKTLTKVVKALAEKGWSKELEMAARVAESAVDTAWSKGTIHKNKAARLKRKLAVLRNDSGTGQAAAAFQGAATAPAFV